MADQPEISIIIPVYNEARRLKPALQRLEAYTSQLTATWELIFVDDGSSDETVQMLDMNSTLAKTVLELRANHGKGWAVRTGMLAATGKQRAFLDADLATPPQELDKLFAALHQGVDVAIGSRINEQGIDLRLVGQKPQSLTRRVLGKVFRMVATRPFLGNIRDSQCGAKAFTAEAAVDLFTQQKLQRWAFDIEILFLAKKMGYTVKEVPVEWSAQDDSKLKPSISLAISVMRELATIIWVHRGTEKK